jgi:hypothetical protein
MSPVLSAFIYSTVALILMPSQKEANFVHYIIYFSNASTLFESASLLDHTVAIVSVPGIKLIP